MAELFKLTNIEYQYLPGQPALTGISLCVNEGDVVSVIGSNGSGKSTLLHLLCGLVFPSKGTITYKGAQLSERSFKDPGFNIHFRSSIGYVFQNTDAQLFCPTVFDELLFGPLQLGLSKAVAIERAEEIMEMLHIREIRNRPAYMISGGEKKRVAIGAVLMSNPETLLFDEPMSGLDPKTRSFLIELFFELTKAGKTIIIATHHLELVSHLQSNVVVLSENHNLEKTGKWDEILSDTDLLLRTNLTGEYPHKHGNLIHKHLSFGL